LSANSRTRNIDSCCASLVHCCGIKKNVIVASQLGVDDAADVQFAVEWTESVESSVATASFFFTRSVLSGVLGFLLKIWVFLSLVKF